MAQDERWMIRYKEVVEFIVMEHREQSKYYPKENLMFHIIHHNKKLNNDGCLKPEMVEKFEKLFALCGEYKRVN